jgi:penicillin G amidase
MRLTAKTFFWFAASLLALLALSLPLAWGWLYLEQPKLSDTIDSADKVREPVRVVRDRYGIPHIFAASMNDAYVALGYLHAQDRLFQMEMQRRAGQGRLSELFGRLTLRTDRMVRALELYRNAETDYAQGGADTKAALQHYADGVNLYLATNRDPAPLEFRVMSLMRGHLTAHRPEPWAPADSVVWGKLMGLQLSGNLYDEIRRALLAENLSAEEIANLTMFGGPEDFTSLAGMLKSGLIDRSGFDWAGLDGALPRLGPNTASNVWAISGKRTASGKPILANDPHLGLEAPVLWYLVRIETPELNLTGVTVPGVPFVILGHNDKAAWGFTTTGGDVMDLFTGKLDPSDPSRYLVDNGSEPFETRQEDIRIDSDKVEKFIIRKTKHGVVISDLDRRLAPLGKDGGIVSLRTTLNEPGDTSWEAIYHLNRATDWNSFHKAMSLFRSGEQNVAFATVGGDIGMYSPALLPVRRLGNGSIPLDGTRIPPNWQGWVPVDELPKVHNPQDGLIINANNRLVDESYPFLITKDWEPDYRARRIASWFKGRKDLTPEDSMALMTDPVSFAARDLMAYLNTLEPETSLQRNVLSALKEWDGAMDRNRPEPLIFATWLGVMPDVLLADDLEPSALAILRSADPRLVSRILSEDQHWCDDVASQPFTETCEQAAITGLSRTLSLLSEKFGPNWRQWRWGEAHKAPLAHQLLGRLPVVGSLFRNNLEMDGGNFTVLRAGGRNDGDGNFPVTHGAGYRAVYDLANLDGSQVMIATGQSGRPFSPYYDNFEKDWQEGNFITIPNFPGTVTPADNAGVLTFSPGTPQAAGQH